MNHQKCNIIWSITEQLNFCETTFPLFENQEIIQGCFFLFSTFHSTPGRNFRFIFPLATAVAPHASWDRSRGMVHPPGHGTWNTTTGHIHPLPDMGSGIPYWIYPLLLVISGGYH